MEEPPFHLACADVQSCMRPGKRPLQSNVVTEASMLCHQRLRQVMRFFDLPCGPKALPGTMTASTTLMFSLA